LEAEKVFRKKHLRLTSHQMEELVLVGLKYLGKEIDDVDTILLAKWNSQFPIDNFSLLGKKFNPIITSHHNNHIGTTYPANFENSLIVCADGGSEDGTTKFYLKKGNNINFLVDLDNTILTGKFYGTITQIVVNPDFIRAHDTYPGQTMGLAALGKFSQEIYDLIIRNRTEINKLHVNGCDHLHKILNISNNFDNIWLDQRRCDLAYTAQNIWCTEFLKKISEYKDVAENICLVGGCALNIILNTEIVNKGWFKNVYISPVSGDSGQSLGALLYHFPHIKCQYPYLGRSFGEIKNNEKLISMITKDLTDHKIIAWYQGPSEIGARALGHRSFLGLADSIEMRKKLSELVKKRQPFRPVAAILTEEFLPKFSEKAIPSSFMTFAPLIKESVKVKLPAITHFDGTSRLQTLKKEDNPDLHAILTEIGKQTGYPVLMNSSFNISGEVVVDTPEEAQQSFTSSLADVLYINGQRYEK